MKKALYKLPFGVIDALEPSQTGTAPDSKAKDGTVIPGKPIYDYRTVDLREAETLSEFQSELVDSDKPDEHTLALAQGAWDIIAQRKVREFCASEEAQSMVDGKHAETKDLSPDDRLEYVMQAAQEIADGYRYGSRPAATGGANAAAKQALTKQKAIQEAAAKDPAIAAKLAELDAQLAALGIKI